MLGEVTYKEQKKLGQQSIAAFLQICSLLICVIQHYHHMELGVSAAPESRGLSSTRIWGSRQHQNLGFSAAPESGTGGSQQHQNLGGLSSTSFSKGVSVAPKRYQQHQNLGVSAAPKGSQQLAGLRTLLETGAYAYL